jgi:hypothetical protein
MHNLQRRLSSLEAHWHLSVLLLTLMATTGCFSLAGRGTTASPNALIVGLADVAKVAKNGCVPDLGGDELTREVRR